MASLFRLSDLTPKEVKAVTERWPQLPEDRRYAIMQHLADLTEENFQVYFEPLFAFCLQDAAASVRRAALEGLWDTDNTDLIPAILNLLANDLDVAVRAAAAGALGHFVLFTEWGQFPESVMAPIVAGLIAQLENPDTPLPVRRAALEAVSSAANERIPAFIESAYNDDDEQMQAAAIYAMGNQADPRWLKDVRLELASHSALLREEAVRAAGNIGSSDLVDEIIDLLHHDDDIAVKLAAVNALGQIGSDVAREALAEVLEDAEAEDLHEAIEEALEEMDIFGQMDLLEYNPDEEE
jgi:HEAT repeat protein